MKNSNEAMHPLYELSEQDAVGILIADHKRVAKLFATFRSLVDAGSADEKAALVQQICRELLVHTQLEEELFYPAVREAIDDDLQMDEALVEQAGAKDLIMQLLGAKPSEALYDAKVTVLGVQIDHHVDEEERSMFPRAQFAGLDTAGLGARMLARKKELEADERQLSVDAPPAPPQSRAPTPIQPKLVVGSQNSQSSRRTGNSTKTPPQSHPSGPSKGKTVRHQPRAALETKRLRKRGR